MLVNWNKKLVWGIKLGELSAFLGLYLFLYLTYCITLTFNELAYVKFTFEQLLKNYLVSQFFDYFIKLILTIPIWFLFFKIVNNWNIYFKLLLHLFMLVIFVFLWQKIFYSTMEALGRGHLRGSSQVWDIYIPALIYIIQFGFFHAYAYHVEVENRKATEADLKEAALKSELSAIKAQLNPHFLYNTFNTINASLPPHMEQTREMIASLADMFRYVLKASKEETVELKEEVEFTEKYLSLEKSRFAERLQTVFEIDQGLLNEKIPPMILQPLVENSVKHGISSLIEGGEIKIEIKKQGNKMRFKVSDTGVGASDLSGLIGSGVGLSNTNLRLEKMYGSQLDILPNTPKGLIVSFSIEYKI
ncbi:sensor histidine kinase [Lacihabitans soyangensis]|uniref:Sensor histidine kinase n=1 Tax=Lacihabitans soyangensis TaxID=869394 RepID=A0AAE3H234_9BACT|nr:histidine kinase [Lacihabitans soyangensis]MCP9762556.1 sensor histidine kinase [Lacihabitans soyangensis]